VQNRQKKQNVEQTYLNQIMIFETIKTPKMPVHLQAPVTSQMVYHGQQPSYQAAQTVIYRSDG